MYCKTERDLSPIPWSGYTLKAGRTGHAERAENLPDEAAWWFTPDDMTPEEESIARNYGFLFHADDLTPIERGCRECGLTGFLLMENGAHGLRIERCDACGTFATDDEAVQECFRLACLQVDREQAEG